jgi:hypothetical protein
MLTEEQLKNLRPLNKNETIFDPNNEAHMKILREYIKNNLHKLPKIKGVKK